MCVCVTIVRYKTKGHDHLPCSSSSKHMNSNRHANMREYCSKCTKPYSRQKDGDFKLILYKYILLLFYISVHMHIHSNTLGRAQNRKTKKNKNKIKQHEYKKANKVATKQRREKRAQKQNGESNILHAFKCITS